MPFTMTKEEALKIQAEQVAHYARIIPDLARKVDAITNADELQDGVEYPVTIVNRFIPRGTVIEDIVTGKWTPKTAKLQRGGTYGT